MGLGLLVKRRVGESVTISGDVELVLTVTKVQGNTVQLSFVAPRSVKVLRTELVDRPAPAAVNGTRP